MPAAGPEADSLPWLEAVCTALPAAFSVVFLSLMPLRLWSLYRRKIKVRRSLVASVKRCLAILLPIGLAADLVAVTKVAPAGPTSPAVLSSIAVLVGGIGVSILSFFEHYRSAKPSDLIVTYLLASVLLDALRIWLLFFSNAVFRLSPFLRFISMGVVLVVETMRKEHLFLSPPRALAPEETAGVIQRTFFWWINGILTRGTLDIDDQPPLHRDLSSDQLRRSMLQAWGRRGKPETAFTLPIALFRCLGSPFLWAIPIRFFLIFFRYSQPLLIRYAIRFVSQPKAPDSTSRQGAWILAVTLIVYTGNAVSTALYQHKLNRLRVMTRGALIGLIYSKTLRSRSDARDSGKAVALMNNDVDSLTSMAEMIHEIWALALEVFIGMVMLASQVHWLWPVPLVIIFICSRVSRFVAQNIRPRQKEWNAATQSRLSAIASFLGSIKTIKLLGISDAIEASVTKLRGIEIEKAKSVRWMRVAYNASANALGIFAPAITMVLYGIVSKMHNSTLSPETAFTVVAVLTIVTHPANMVMTIVPQVVACFSSFERIQAYLLEAPWHDNRVDISRNHTLGRALGDQDAIELSHITVQDPHTNKLILEDISTNIPRSDVVICCGATGSGKSSLGKVILGEMMPSQGHVGLHSRRVGYCDQTQWLPNGSIQDVVCNFEEEIDVTRYANAIEAACLRHDLDRFPERDQTEIGSRGLNLSGGQRQRVALARMIYAACDIVVLDDPFSALDGKTEKHVVESLLGPSGILRTRQTTVFWICNTTHYFEMADMVIILDNSRIKEQGHWSILNFEVQLSQKLVSDDAHPSQNGQLAEEMENWKKKAKEQDAMLDIHRQTGDLSLYSYYFRSAGYFSAVFMILCTATYSFYITFPQYWLKWWTEADASAEWFYIAGYVLFALLAWTATNGTMWSTFMLVAPKSGLWMHSSLLSTIISAPLEFFATTDIGIILNRFSQDIQLVDKDLPAAVSALSNQVFKLLMQVSLLFSVQKLLILSLPVCMGIIYIIQKRYLRTSRQVRLLELESRSAVFSHILETAEGLATIRAFGWQAQFQAKFDRFVNISQGPNYLLFCLQRWLNLVLDLMVAGIAVFTTAVAIHLPGSTSGSDIGVALSIILLTNTTLLRLVESWATLEISLGAISRLKQINNETLREDQPWETLDCGENWPSQGSIVIDKVTAKYNADVVALRNVSLKIQPGQKIVICGRTGSGKSTLLLALLRLVNCTGLVAVDGQDLSQLPRSVIRQRCFITVPQDSLLMQDASLRFNLDPFNQAPPETIVSALQKTQLWSDLSRGRGSDISDNDVSDILNRPISELSFLSVGQQQLLSFTRALVRKETLRAGPSAACKPILLLDEATSSLDPTTESLINDLIDEEFSSQGHTVIIVAHRASVLTKWMRPGIDQVVLMSDGQVERVCSAESVLHPVVIPAPSPLL